MVATLLGVVVLGIVVLVHECGRYVVARCCGIRVERFRIGFGPTIFERTSPRTGTVLRIGAIPLAGFVSIRGMERAEPVDPDDAHAYPNRPAGLRLLAVLGGPATSYLSAAALAMVLYHCGGLEVPRWYDVDEVMAGYDAVGKLEHGDRILEIDHVPLIVGAGPTLAERVQGSRGAPMTLTIERAGQRRDVEATPKQDHDDGRSVWRLGVRPTPGIATIELGVIEAARSALAYPADQAAVLVRGLHAALFESEPVEVGGPVRMVKEFSRAYAFSARRWLALVMALSVYIGMILLLPIPGLDGWRLMRWLLGIARR